ncbi:MAG: type IV pilus modification PilV family protein [Actinomycetota bacterium]
MIRKSLKTEFGYTLVEVMASIILLSFAIIPMAGMFDMGIEAATAGSNYDKARTLANLKLEEAKSLPFAVVENDFPEPGNTTPYDSAWLTEGDFSNFQYRVEKQYICQPDPDSPSQPWLPPPDGCDGPTTDLIRITVTVQWADGNEYRTFGLVSK